MLRNNNLNQWRWLVWLGAETIFPYEPFVLRVAGRVSGRMLMSDKGSEDHPGVVTPPPVIFGACLLAGLWLESAWFDGRLAPVLFMVIGGFLALVGLAVILASIPLFFRAGTGIEPWKPASAILSDGVYGYSRNPIYLGMALGTLGAAIAAASWPAVAGTAIAVLVIRYYVIAREERYLERRFGEEYRAYRAKVRRWI